MTVVVERLTNIVTVVVERAATNSTVVVSRNVTSVVVSRQGIPGPQGIPGTGVESLTPVLVGLQWGSPGGESGNAIEISGTIKDFAGADLASSLVDMEILVSDGATDNEPSATAVLSAASVPVGTVLSGSGTARLGIRTDAGALSIKVTETLVAHRYLWVKASGHARLWVRSLTGVQEIIFT